MNSNMVKPGKFGHFHLVYHFTIPLKGFKGRFISVFMYILFDILFEKLAAQPGLGTQFCFKDPSDLQVDIAKMQQLTLG